MSPSLRRIGAILAKDLREAVRDGRILVLLLLPIGLAVFYNSTAPDENERPQTTVAIVDPGRTGLAAELRKAARSSVDLKIVSAEDAADARQLVIDDDAELAVIAERDAGGQAPPRARVLLRENATPTAQSVVALVDDAVAAAADRPAATQVSIEPVAVPASERKPADVIDQATILVVISVIMLLGFVALMVVPMQTAEEIGTGTFGALRLAATGSEILAAKALGGLLYAVGGTALTLAITGVEVHDPVRLYGGAIALAISLTGFGLLLGFLSGNANQINTYGGFIVFPMILLASAVLFVDSGFMAVVLDVLPISQGARLLFDGVSPQEPFATGAVAWLVLAAWGLAGFAVLARIARRRDA